MAGPMFQSFIQAGFECGRLEWQKNFCLLSGSRHLPEQDMRAHYAILLKHGIRTVRDGLPWWLPIEPRLRVAQAMDLEVIWDLNHYWRHPDAAAYAERVAAAVEAVCPDRPFWCCFNELSFHPVMCRGESFESVVRQSREILGCLRARLPDVRLITAEPAHRPHEIGAHAALADLADVIGINVYPHEMKRSITRSLRDVAARYGKPVMIAETGLHKGHRRRWKGIDDKGEWLRHVIDAVHRSGVPVAGLCLYPIVNAPAWNAPHRRRWDHGLIREDLSVDQSLSQAIMEATANSNARKEAIKPAKRSPRGPREPEWRQAAFEF